MSQIRFTRLLAACLLILSLLAVEHNVSAQNLSVRVGNQKRVVSTRSRNGVAFYRLVDLGNILGLRIHERGSQLVVTGSRGQLTLNDKRPLVRSGDQYILLSEAVWRRGKADWYVPADFLDKALSNILSQRFVRQRDGTYRVELVGENRVWVDVLDYPDHVSIVFRSSRPANVEVREFREFIEVQFGDFLVIPQSVARPASLKLVSSITFNPNEKYGAFRLGKGRSFRRFSQYRLSNPSRLVIDVYGIPEAAAGGRTPESVPSSGGGSSEAKPDAGTNMVDADRESVRRGERNQAPLVIDPGHGGGDYGVDIDLDLQEKGLNLILARQIAEEFEGRAGENARLTRSRDVQLSSEQRSAVCNFYQGKAFVSIHLGGSPSPSSRGPVVYVFSPGVNLSEKTDSRTGSSVPAEQLIPWNEGQNDFLDQSRHLAQLMQTALNRLFETRNRVVEAHLAVLAPVRAPAVLIEAGHLTNAEDREFLLSTDNQRRVATLIADTARRFLDSQ